MKVEESYYRNPTRFEWFAAEISGFQPASEVFSFIFGGELLNRFL